MLKQFLLKKLIQSKLKGLPSDQQERIVGMVTKNPALFEEIAKKIKAKTDAGAEEMMATITVMKEYQKQIQQLFRED